MHGCRDSIEHCTRGVVAARFRQARLVAAVTVFDISVVIDTCDLIPHASELAFVVFLYT